MENKNKILRHSVACKQGMTKLCAFTLAEVLITLGIIGVVAALTIPTLVANYQTKSWNTAADVFEKRLTEAIKTMNVQGKLGSYGGYSTTESFVEELQKHFKIAKVCDKDHLRECFEDRITMNDEEVDMTTVTTANNFGQDDWDTNIMGILVANGTSALIAYNPKCHANPYDNDITGSDCYAILYDTSGFSSPNEMGKDVRKNGGVKSISGKNCAFKVGSACYAAPIPQTSATYEECMANKDKYNIQACCPVGTCNNKDYYAGAIIACGGKDNVPSLAELSEFASNFYVGNPKMVYDSNVGYGQRPTINYANFDSSSEYAKAMGLSPIFRLASNEMKQADYAVGKFSYWAWAFEPTMTEQWSYDSWNNAPVHVMCKVK